MCEETEGDNWQDSNQTTRQINRLTRELTSFDSSDDHVFVTTIFSSGIHRV